MPCGWASAVEALRSTGLPRLVEIRVKCHYHDQKGRNVLLRRIVTCYRWFVLPLKKFNAINCSNDTFQTNVVLSDKCARQARKYTMLAYYRILEPHKEEKNLQIKKKIFILLWKPNVFVVHTFRWLEQIYSSLFCHGFLYIIKSELQKLEIPHPWVIYKVQFD